MYAIEGLPDPSEVADRVQAALLSAWLRRIESGEMTRDQLFVVRGRVDPIQREFLPGELLDQVRLAVMAALGVQLGDLPDSDPLPDFVPEDFA